MMKILRRTNLTGVKVFINTLICATALISSTSFAEESGSFADKAVKDQEKQKAIEAAEKEGGSGWREAERCENLRRDARDSARKISDSCKSAGLGTECASKAQKCAEEMGEESYDTFSTAMSAFGLPPTASAAAIQGACPQWSAKDFYDKKKDYQDDLEEAKKEIADITKEKADAEKDLTDTLAEIQENLDNAQAELDKLGLDQNDKKRQRIQQFQENQAKLKADIRANKLQKINLEGELVTKLQVAAIDLLKVSKEAGGRYCRDTVTKMRGADKAAKSKKGMQGLVGGGNTANSDYLQIYNDCIANIDSQRKAVITRKKTDEDTIRQKLVDNEEQANELQQALDLSQTQLDEIAKDAEKEKDNEQNKVIKQMQLAQQKMTAANNNMQKKLLSLQQKEKALNEKINSINSDMTMVLGSKPKAGSTTTANEASSTIDGEIDNIMDYAKSGCQNAPSVKSVEKKYERKAEKSRNQ